MMGYQRGEKHKERDVPHATCMTENLNKRAEQIKEHLDQILKVRGDANMLEVLAFIDSGRMRLGECR